MSVTFPKSTPSRGSVRAAAALGAVLMSVTMIGATAPIAGASENEVESASEAVYWAVTRLPNSTIRGRTIETLCSGRRTTFSCNWWVIKGRFDRRAQAAEDELPLMMRRGEGNAHRTPKRVLTSGKATAVWACSKQRVGRKIVTVCDFSVSLK